MLDWFQILFNAVWLLGLALIVAAFSYVYWLAGTQGVRPRQLLVTSTFQLPLSIGMLFVALGLFFLGRGWLEHLLWAVFVLLFTRQGWHLWRNRS